MTPDSAKTKAPRRDVVDPRPFQQAMAWTIIVWLLGVVVMCVMIEFDMLKFSEMGLRDALFLAFASLFISQVSMMPNLMASRLPKFSFRSRRQGDGSPQNPREDTSQVTLLGFGILFRLLGTVALFLTCGYHMPSRTETIAAMTIGWYVLLTFVEVLVVARKLPNYAQPAPTSDSESRLECVTEMGDADGPERVSLKQSQNVG